MRVIIVFYFLIIGLCVAGFCQSTIGQSLSTYFNFPHNKDINNYYFSKNPAFLSFDSIDEVLSIKTEIDKINKTFKRFIEPEIDENYRVSASGKKSINSKQFFKGSFSFVRLNRKNWDWAFVRDYNSNRFIIGDSTTGNSRYNGILLSSEYSNNISESFLIGAGIDYFVDEGLKQISPRPTSENRMILLSFGFGFTGIEDLSLGLTFAYKDNMEKIRYSEDQSAITKETIILKFKGFDFPNVFRKKTETRYSYINDYSSKFNLSYQFSDKLTVYGLGKTGQGSSVVKDDAINPQSEGFQEVNYLTAELLTQYKFSDNNDIGFYMKNYSEDIWGKSPKFGILLFEESFKNLHLGIASENGIFNKSKLSLECEIDISQNRIDDYYSNVFAEVNGKLLFASVGISHRFTDAIFSGLSFGYGGYRVNNKNFVFKDNSDYFMKYRIGDISYLLTDYNTYKAKMFFKIDNIFTGEIIGVVDYQKIVPDSKSDFSGKTRDLFSGSIEYRVKVY